MNRVVYDSVDTAPKGIDIPENRLEADENLKDAQQPIVDDEKKQTKDPEAIEVND